MVASRTQAYEFAFNVQINKHWAYSIGGWVKDMDQLSSATTFRSMLGEYSVAANADYGTAKGIDFDVENRGQLINTSIQYSFSIAKGNGEYDKAAFGNRYVDAPTQEYTMPYDRPHDLTVSIYSTKLPYNITAGLNGFYQSGIPYTPQLEKGDGEPYDDELNKYSKRSPSIQQIDLSISKDFSFRDLDITFGLNVFNLFNEKNIFDVYTETGKPDVRSEYYTREIGLPEWPYGGTVSNSYYDRPWMYDKGREINFFFRIDYK